MPRGWMMRDGNSQWGIPRLNSIIARKSATVPRMGAWGIETFENDKAQDWIHTFRANPSERLLLDAFEAEYDRPPGFLDRFLKPRYPRRKYITGEHVLASAEVIATLLGRPPSPTPEDLKDLPCVVIGRGTSAKAIEAIDRMLADSDLQSCWEQETKEYPDWLSSVMDIRERLTIANA